MTVEEWTDEDLLVEAIDKIKLKIEDLTVQRKSSYVPKALKDGAETEFRKKINTKEILLNHKVSMRKRIATLQHGIEVMQNLKQHEKNTLSAKGEFNTWTWLLNQFKTFNK